MPLPRYGRLTYSRQQSLLSIAGKHFARDGYDKASFNEIIAECKISKTSAYLYFDGKQDLYQTVIQDLQARLSHVLGDWSEVNSPQMFWKNLDQQSQQLEKFLNTNKNDQKLSEEALFNYPDGIGRNWLQQLIRNGINIGIIRKDMDNDLILEVTISFFSALDRWALQKLKSKEKPDIKKAWNLLENLWKA